MGDGALIQFNSALDAVNCAIHIQEIARAKFDGKIRIGIHLGDVVCLINNLQFPSINSLLAI